jgi:RNA polymerase sigma-70 factor (ECF subfamily)
MSTVGRIERGTDDRGLVEAAKNGDRAALDELLRRHYDRVHAVCRRILGRDADADDATQDALIAAVRGLRNFDGSAAFSTWMYRVATNTCLDHLRRAKRRPTVPLDELTTESLSGLGPRLDTAVVDREVLEAALADLPIDFRTAVVLRDVLDFDYQEISDTLGIPIGTVRSRIARGRGVLARTLGNQTDGSRRPTERP